MHLTLPLPPSEYWRRFLSQLSTFTFTLCWTTYVRLKAAEKTQLTRQVTVTTNKRPSNPLHGLQTPLNLGIISGSMLRSRRFLFGNNPIQPLSFISNRPQAAKMYLESLQSQSSAPLVSSISTITPISLHSSPRTTQYNSSILPAERLFIHLCRPARTHTQQARCSQRVPKLLKWSTIYL